MAREPIIIGRLTFNTKKQATEHFKTVLNRYKPGDTVSREDHSDLEALFERHPERVQKLGGGIAKITIEQATYGQQCFWITRIDGTKTDISYRTCIDAAPPSRKAEVMEAFRESVRLDIVVAKRMKFDTLKTPDGKIPCPETGEALGWDDIHADHQQPMTFEVICKTFLASRKISWEDVPISSSADEQLRTVITDRPLAEEFRLFHKVVAQIRLVSKRRNLHEGPKHRLRKDAATRKSQVKL